MVFFFPPTLPPIAQPAPTATFQASTAQGDYVGMGGLAFSREDLELAEELQDRIDARMAEHLLETASEDDFEPYDAVRIRLGLA